MFARFLVALALCLASSGCGSVLGLLGIGRGTLELEVSAVPRGDNYNSTTDYEGLAGLWIKLSGSVERTFVAADLPVRPFSVPRDGSVHVEVALSDGSRQVAWGRGSWALSPGVAWKLRFERGPFFVDGDTMNWLPPAPSIPGRSVELCSWPGCREYWRFDIAEDARNYEGEVLWMVLLAPVRCPEGEVC
ncbi:hypothetical protein [Candidatus Palauibacter sp.]|uniref:hypothetical protein n=1 Tax=Candidatus Palauibacter sp. TaxID=3101350 RepID=UPI003B526485